MQKPPRYILYTRIGYSTLGEIARSLAPVSASICHLAQFVSLLVFVEESLGTNIMSIIFCAVVFPIFYLNTRQNHMHFWCAPLRLGYFNVCGYD